MGKGLGSKLDLWLHGKNCVHGHRVATFDVTVRQTPHVFSDSPGIWDYSKANVPEIRRCVNDTDWQDLLNGLNPGDMAAKFTEISLKILSPHIPNKNIKINDKDAPWITPELKSAIKRKHRMFRKYVRRGRSHEDWKTGKESQAENSKQILDAKNSYYLKLGKNCLTPA